MENRSLELEEFRHLSYDLLCLFVHFRVIAVLDYQQTRTIVYCRKYESQYNDFLALITNANTDVALAFLSL